MAMAEVEGFRGVCGREINGGFDGKFGDFNGAFDVKIGGSIEGGKCLILLRLFLEIYEGFL
jgi:hypothetical protein